RIVSHPAIAINERTTTARTALTRMSCSLPSDRAADRLAKARGSRLGRGQRALQFLFHALEALLRFGASRLALVGDLEALLDRRDEVGISAFDCLDVEDAPLHFPADLPVGTAEILGIAGKEIVGEVARLAHGVGRLARSMDRHRLR